MENEITPHTIKKLLESKGMKQKELCNILTLTPQKVSQMMNSQRKISESEKKLLKLYFYGIMPFEMIRPEEELSNTLKFTGSEWKVIGILATREGYTSPQAWITAQIRGYLRNIENTTSTLKVAEEPTPYGSNNIIDPSTEQNNNGGDKRQPPA